MSKQTRTRGENYEAPVPVPRSQRTRGRKSTYDDEILPEVLELVSQGATSREIAQTLGVDPSTFWRWQQACPQLRNAVKQAKDVQDERVVDALRINAVLEGNVTAQIFWLKNRQPELWRDRKETEIIVPPSDEEAAQLDSRSAALAALALFNEAQYDPTAAGILLEATANAEENDDGEEGSGEQAPARGLQGEAAADDDWDEPSGYDLDPGEL
jgi:transposase-like protein